MGISIKFKNILDVGTSIVLRKLGFGKFDNLRRLISIEDYGGKVPDMDLWLIPADKYDDIPKGYQVTDIFGKTEPFAGRKTCCKSDVGPNGLLPIGVLRPAEADNATESVQFVLSKTIIHDRRIFATGEPATESWQLQFVACEEFKVIEEPNQSTGSASVRLDMLNKKTATKLAKSFKSYKQELLSSIKSTFPSIRDVGCGIVTTNNDDMSVVIFKFASSKPNFAGKTKLHAEVCRFIFDKFKIAISKQ